MSQGFVVRNEGGELPAEDAIFDFSNPAAVKWYQGLLVKEHTAIPHIRVAQSTAELNWHEIELRVFSSEDATASALFSLPAGELHTLKLAVQQSEVAMPSDHLQGKVRWRITRFETR